jgi:hypothetical protein
MSEWALQPIRFVLQMVLHVDVDMENCRDVDSKGSEGVSAGVSWWWWWWERRRQHNRMGITSHSDCVENPSPRHSGHGEGGDGVQRLEGG